MARDPLLMHRRECEPEKLPLLGLSLLLFFGLPIGLCLLVTPGILLYDTARERLPKPVEP